MGVYITQTCYRDAMTNLFFWNMMQHCNSKLNQAVELCNKLRNLLTLKHSNASLFISFEFFKFQHSIGLPDVHSGYGFAIGNMAAFDMADPNSVVSPGGVGFDINCGVRLLRTNLTEKDVQPMKEQLAQCLFDHIPVGVGSKGIIPMTAK